MNCSRLPATEAIAASIVRRAGGHRGPGSEHGDDDGEVPRDGRRVRQEEPAMAVQNPETPCGEHQQCRAREENPHQGDGERAGRAAESWRKEIDQEWRTGYAGQHHNAQDQRQPRQHGARHASRALVVVRAEPARVHGNERRRQRAFAEKILQQVGNAEGGGERVGLGAESEVMRKRALANQSRQAAQHDAARHEYGGGATGKGQGLLGGGRVGRLD